MLLSLIVSVLYTDIYVLYTHIYQYLYTDIYVCEYQLLIKIKKKLLQYCIKIIVKIYIFEVYLKINKGIFCQ